MVTKKPSNTPTKIRFFDSLFRRHNEQKEEKQHSSTQTAQSTELVLKARTAYDTVPEALTDLFTSELLVEPVLTKYGDVYEKQQLVTWLQSHSECPKRNPLTLSDLEYLTPAEITLQNHINSIIQDYTTERASFLELITNGKVAENDILDYQATTTQAVNDFQQTIVSMVVSEIETQLLILYRKSCFPPTIESYDDFCDQVLVLSVYNEWIPKSCASSSYTEYKEYKEITDDLWKLNNKLIQLKTAIESEASNQLRTTISQLHAEYQRIQGNMQSIKQQLQISSRRDVDEYHVTSLPDGNSAPFLQYRSVDLDLEFKPISTEQCLRFLDNPAPNANHYSKDEALVENNMNDAVSQSPQCSCSLFLKIISAVALANGILLLIVLHTPVGFAAGITSLCAGGLTLFAASREKKHDALPNAPAAAHLVSP